MTKPYEESKLWQNSFGNIAAGDDARRRLASEYASAWGKACSLANRIARDAHGLTLHDEAHFSSLWKCADIIAGPNYSLSPAETFIFGMAILIHDAAHTVLAFEGGIESLSQTPEWQDAIASRTSNLNADGPVAELLPDEKRAVLFDVLRALHAKQAQSILNRGFKHPSLGTDYYLIDDPTIRNHFAHLVGSVAASHHWNISRLESLGRQRNAIAPYDKLGPIRPLVLGALMRTADAIQFDAGRAPDFEFALTQPRGTSKDHWAAQNRLSVAPDLKDPTALLVTNSVPFSEEEAEAWWIAFDLASTADQELRSSSKLLRDADLPPFEITEVKGISDPARFSEHVTTHNWHPVDAQVKINDTAKIVEMFGGIGLYGDKPTVPLRELLQNAVDAVRARRLLDADYEGRILVSIKSGANTRGEHGHWLIVADDGIGMSSATLTGPFLAFGESGWSSSVLRAERPGFLGKRFHHIGRFGIGFFSVFMISSEINVTSRPFDKAATDAKTLTFRQGLALRPLVKNSNGEHGMLVSTSVELFISADTRTQLLHEQDEAVVMSVGKTSRRPASTFTLRALVEMLCPAIDVVIDVSEDDALKERIGSGWAHEEPEPWLRRITGVQQENIPAIVKENYALLDVITLEGGRHVGRAALNPTNARLSVYSVGGLGEKRLGHMEKGGRHHVGCIDTSPRGPNREFGSVVSESALAAWANRQVARWTQIDISDAEKNFISANASHFGGDPTPIANCLVDNAWLSVPQVFDLLNTGNVITSPIKPLDHKGARWCIAGVVNYYSGRQLFQDDVVVTLKNVLRAGPTADIQAYWAIPEDDSADMFGFIGCLTRYARNKGKTLCFDGKQYDFGYYNGETVSRERLKHGDRLNLAGVSFSLLDR